MMATIAAFSSTFLIIIVSLTGAICRQDTCNFDNGLCGWVQGDSDNFNWTRTYGGRSKIKTGPKSVHTSGNDTKDYYMIIDASLRKEGERAVLKRMGFDHEGRACLSFWYHMHGLHIGTLKINVIKNGDSPLLVWSKTGSQSENWTHAAVDLEIGSNATIEFEAIRGNENYTNMALDDVSLTYESCFNCAFDYNFCLWKDNQGWKLSTNEDKSECGLAKVDLVFVLDATTSVTQGNFVKMLDFVKSCLAGADVDNGNVRVGALIYSTGVNIQFHLNKYSDKASMFDAIDNIPYIYGSTNTADGLEAMHYQMFTEDKGDRPDVPNVAVVITDGISNINARRTIPEAEDARASGIHIYAIGIGLVDDKELRGIASEPVNDNTFSVQDFDELAGLEKRIFTSFCSGEPSTGMYATTHASQGCVPHIGVNNSLGTPVHAMQGPVCISFLYFLNGSDNRLQLYINSQDNEPVIWIGRSSSTWRMISLFVNESSPNFTLAFEMYPGRSCLGETGLKNVSVAMGKCQGSTVIRTTTSLPTDHTKRSDAAIIGSVVGSLVFVVVLVFVAVCIFRKKQCSRERNSGNAVVQLPSYETLQQGENTEDYLHVVSSSNPNTIQYYNVPSPHSIVRNNDNEYDYVS